MYGMPMGMGFTGMYPAQVGMPIQGQMPPQMPANQPPLLPSVAAIPPPATPQMPPASTAPPPPMPVQGQEMPPRNILNPEYYSNVDIAASYLGPTGLSNLQTTPLSAPTVATQPQQVNQSIQEVPSTDGVPQSSYTSLPQSFSYRPSDNYYSVSTVSAGTSGSSGHNAISRLTHNRLFFDSHFAYKKSIPIGMVVQPMALPYSYNNDDIIKAWTGTENMEPQRDKIAKRVPVVKFKNNIVRCPSCLAFVNCYTIFSISSIHGENMYKNTEKKTIDHKKCNINMRCVICGQLTKVSSDYKRRIIRAFNNCKDKSLLLVKDYDEHKKDSTMVGLNTINYLVDKSENNVGNNIDGKRICIMNPFRDALELQYGTYDINIGSVMAGDNKKDYATIPVESYELRHLDETNESGKSLKKVLKPSTLPEKPSFVFVIDAYAYSLYNGYNLQGTNELIFKKANENILRAQIICVYNALKRIQLMFDYEVNEASKTMDLSGITEIIFSIVVMSKEGIHLFEPIYDEMYNVVELKETIVQPSKSGHIPIKKKVSTGAEAISPDGRKDSGNTFNYFFRLSSYKNVIDSLFDHLLKLGKSSVQNSSVNMSVTLGLIPGNSKPPASLVPSTISICEMLMSGEYIDYEINRFTNTEVKEKTPLPTLNDDDIPYHKIIFNPSAGSAPVINTSAMQQYQKKKYGRIVVFGTLSAFSIVECLQSTISIERMSEKAKSTMKGLGLYASRQGVSISAYIIDNITAIGNSLQKMVNIPHSYLDVSLIPLETAANISGGKLRYDPSYHQQWCQVPEITKEGIFVEYDKSFYDACQTSGEYLVSYKGVNKLNEVQNGISPEERDKAFNTVLFSPNNPLIRLVLDVCSHFGASAATPEFQIETSDMDVVSCMPCTTGYDTIFRVRASPVPTLDNTTYEKPKYVPKPFDLTFIGPLLMRTSDLCGTGVIDCDNTITIVFNGFKTNPGEALSQNDAVGAPIKPIIIQSSLIYSTLLGFRRIRVDTRRISVYRSSYNFNSSSIPSTFSIASNIGNQNCLTVDIDVLLSVLSKVVINSWSNEEGASVPDTSTNSETVLSALEDIRSSRLGIISNNKKAAQHTNINTYYGIGKDTFRNISKIIVQYASNTCNDAFESNSKMFSGASNGQLPKELALLPIYSFCLAKHIRRNCCSDSPEEKNSESLSLSYLLELNTFISSIMWGNSHRIRCLVYPRIYPIPYIRIAAGSNLEAENADGSSKENSRNNSIFPRVLRLSNRKIKGTANDLNKDKTMFVSSGIFMVETANGLYIGRINGCDNLISENIVPSEVSLNMKMVAQLAQYVRRSRGTHIPIWPIMIQVPPGTQPQKPTTPFGNWGIIPGKYLIEDGFLTGGEGSAIDQWTSWLNDEIAKL